MAMIDFGGTKMKPLTVLFIAFGVQAAWAEPSDSPIPFMGGAGATTCAKWSTNRAQPGSILSFGLEGWAVGFVSGAFLIENSPHPLPIVESNVIERIDSYCYDHPSDRVFQAAAHVTADLFSLEATQLRGLAAEREAAKKH